MRTLALAAVFGVGLLAGGIAAAEQWTAPSGLLTFNAPAGWRVQPRTSSGDATVVLAFNPTNDCYFFGLPNPATAASTPNSVRNTNTPIAADAWVTSAGAINDFFSGATPTVVSQTVDTSGFWPVQRAELSGGSKTVYGAIMARPGVEIRAFCSGANSGAAYDSIFASLGHPNDAAWQQLADEQRAASEAAAAAAAAQAAQPAPEQPAPQQERNRRSGRSRSNN